MTDTAPIVFEGARFAYRETEVLKGVDLSVGLGEICALIGDNGAGKSTMARLAVGECSPTGGSVRLFGCDPARFRDWRRVGYVPQLPPTAVERFPATVFELVYMSQYASASRFGKGARCAKERARRALNQVDMGGFERRMCRELSGGQLQRVRLACALAGGPDLLILDEPATGLDAESSRAFYDLVRHIHLDHGIGVFMITHDHEALSSLGCRVVTLRRGVIERDVPASAPASDSGCSTCLVYGSDEGGAR